MNRIERGFEEVRGKHRASLTYKLRDAYGMYGANIMFEGQCAVFSVCASPKHTPMQYDKQKTMLSCNTLMCDKRVPVLLYHIKSGVLYKIDYIHILSQYKFRNWLNGQLMLNFYAEDVDAEVFHIRGGE